MRSFEETQEGSDVPGYREKKPPRVSPIGCLCRQKPIHPGGRPDKGLGENYEDKLGFQKKWRLLRIPAMSSRFCHGRWPEAGIYAGLILNGAKHAPSLQALERGESIRRIGD